jgi:hypothetical protein
MYKHHQHHVKYGASSTLSCQGGGVKGKIKIIISGLVISLMLAIVTAVPSLAAEESSVPAGVTVGTIINFTIEDRGDSGLRFGSLNPGSDNNPESDQNSSIGAVRLSLGADTSVDCDINIKADDFTSGSNILPISNVKWNTDNYIDGATVMTGSYAHITTLSPGEGQDVWYWLSIPTKQKDGIYSTTFYYQAVRTIP